MAKYKISLSDLQNRDGGVQRLYKDGHTKHDVMQAVHNLTDQHNFTYKTRTDQKEMVQNLFDKPYE